MKIRFAALKTVAVLITAFLGCLPGHSSYAQSSVFAVVKGTYQGLFFETNEVAFESSGFVAATVTDKGTFSGKIQFMGRTYSGSGQFQTNGSYSTSIPRPGAPALNIALQLDLLNGKIMTGQVSDGSRTAELLANRAVYSKTNPAPQVGKYTVVFPGNDNPSSNAPAGHGFAALTVDALGKVKLSGALGDGSKLAFKTFVSETGQFPLYLSLYSGTGCAFGWFTFTNDPGNAIAGHLDWIKLAQPAAKLFPNGFTNGIQSIGSPFQFTSGYPVLNLTTGQLWLAEGNLAADFSNEFVLGPNNKATGTNGLSIKFITSSGLFKGTVNNPASGKRITINGIALQSANSGFGYFPGTNQSGTVSLTPPF